MRSLAVAAAVVVAAAAAADTAVDTVVADFVAADENRTGLARSINHSHRRNPPGKTPSTKARGGRRGQERGTSATQEKEGRVSMVQHASSHRSRLFRFAVKRKPCSLPKYEKLCENNATPASVLRALPISAKKQKYL